MNEENIPAKQAEHISEVTNVKCPLCKNGFMASIQGKYGVYWMCNSDAKPKCKFSTSTKPTGNICTYKRGATPDAICGALMVEGTKTIPERCSDKACPNRNPHKL